MSDPGRITLAWTGASGAPYGLRLLEQLLAAEATVELIVSKAAQLVMAEETYLDLPAQPQAMAASLREYLDTTAGTLHVYGREQWTAPVASGSNPSRAMVICPCTTGTVGAVAAGTSDNLVDRAADVALKEGRALILVVRETPLSLVHLENLTRLARMGAVVLPANPGFYHSPVTVQDLVDFIVARVLDHLAIRHGLVTPWGAEQ